MKYYGTQLDEKAIDQTAAMMAAAIRTAPKSCGADTIETVVVDGEDKERLAEIMRVLAEETGMDFYNRDAENVRKAQCVVLAGAIASYMATPHCSYCGMKNCGEARTNGVTCAFSGVNLGIALGSAVSIAADCRVDNRIMFSVGKAAIRGNFFQQKITLAYGIPLSVSGKSIFYDRNMVSISKPVFVD